MKTMCETKKQQIRKLFWINQKDRRPAPFVTVIICDHSGYIEMGYRHANGWFSATHHEQVTGITHWADMPEAPDRDSKIVDRKMGGKR